MCGVLPMEKVFAVCLIVGFMVPLLSIITGLFDGFVDFLALDVLTLDVGGIDIDFLPLSVNSISFGVLVYGGLGLLLYGNLPLLYVNLISGGAGYICAVLVQAGIGALKRTKNLAEESRDLLNRKARVTNTIMQGGFGAVSLHAASASVVSCPAKSEDGTEIKQGELVETIRFEQSYLIVRRLNQE